MFRSILLGLLIFALALGGLAGYRIHEFLSVPPRSPGETKIVYIEPGQSFDAVAAMLVEEGALRDATGFRLLAKFTEKGGKIKAARKHLLRRVCQVLRLSIGDTGFLQRLDP